MITYRNPETRQIVKSQFTDSWMFEKQGLRLFMDGMGPGYAFEINTPATAITLWNMEPPEMVFPALPWPGRQSRLSIAAAEPRLVGNLSAAYEGIRPTETSS